MTKTDERDWADFCLQDAVARLVERLAGNEELLEVAENLPEPNGSKAQTVANLHILAHVALFLRDGQRDKEFEQYVLGQVGAALGHNTGRSGAYPDDPDYRKIRQGGIGP